MDLPSETADELLIQSLEESDMAVEYIDSICLETNIISENSSGEILTSDDAGVPITFRFTDSGVSNVENVVTLSSEDLDYAKSSIQINDSPPRSQNLEKVQNSVYTIHLSENGMTKASDIIGNSKSGNDDLSNDIDDDENDDLDIDKIDLDIDSIKHQSDLHIMETTTRLEEFMDVVTTYRCKFCRFSCPWKSGLGSHIRNCHMKINKSNTTSQVHNYASTKPNFLKRSYKVQELEEHGYSQSPDLKDIDFDDRNSSDEIIEDDDIEETLQEENEVSVFLCGQCSEGFKFLEDCRNHMIKDHNLKLTSSDLAKVKNGITSSKRGRPKSRPILQKLQVQCKSSEDSVDDPKPLSESGNDPEISSKRTSRPPKILEEDYVLGEKKRKVFRENIIEKKPFRCNEKGCGYRFSSKSYLDYHLSCHSFSERPFICPECGESSENWRSLSVHLWKEHTVDVDLQTCEECGYKTYSTFKLDNHKKIHSDERNFVCDVCNKGFKQLSQLRNHVVIHSDRKNMIEKRWYSEQKCEVCSRTFSDSKCLKKHQQAVHSKLKPFVCTFCGHMSARKAMLQLHMRQHTGEKPFVCDHCEYRTGDHNSLRRHRMRHTGTKPYKCPHCPYACIQAISYKTHLKNKHPGLEGLYACSMCPFRSVSKENYFNHVSDHRRGAIPGMQDDDDVKATNNELIESQQAEVHLPDTTLQQLEGMLPSNMTAAELLYSCLNAMSNKNGQELPSGITATSASDGTQTITIQLPEVTELENEEKYYLTVEQDGTETAVLLPLTNEDIIENDPSMDIFRPITIMHEGNEIGTLDPQELSNLNQETLISIDVSGLTMASSESYNVVEAANIIQEENSKCIV